MPGVGDALTSIIRHRYGIPACQRCHETAGRMNLLGVDGCRAAVDELAKEIELNAKARLWTSIAANLAGFTVGDYARLVLEACDTIEAATNQAE